MITGLNHITLAVKNLEVAFNFYHKVLGLTPLCRWHTGAYFLAGETWFCLSQDDSTATASDYTHIAFTISPDQVSAWHERLTTSGYLEFKANISEGDSIYILDPDQHKIELHVGTWQSRLKAKFRDLGSWQDVEFFVKP